MNTQNGLNENVLQVNPEESIGSMDVDTTVENVQGTPVQRPVMKSGALTNLGLAIALAVASCTTKDTPTPINVEQVAETKYKEYVVNPKPGEVCFTLPNGEKVITDNLVSFDVKENLTNGDKTVKLVFEGTKLKQALTDALISMRASYPDGRYGLNISFAKLTVSGSVVNLTSPIEFVEKYDKSITAIGIDQLIDEKKYSFEDLMKLGGNIGGDSGVNVLSKQEKLMGFVGAGVESNTFSGYTVPNRIIFEI